MSVNDATRTGGSPLPLTTSQETVAPSTQAQAQQAPEASVEPRVSAPVVDQLVPGLAASQRGERLGAAQGTPTPMAAPVDAPIANAFATVTAVVDGLAKKRTRTVLTAAIADLDKELKTLESELAGVRA